MTFNPLPTVSIGKANQDAFGRLSMALPEPLFDSMNDYGDNILLWDNKVSGGAVAVTANVGKDCTVRLTTTDGTNGNYAYRASKNYHKYQPGRSLNVETTFAMGAVKSNGLARIGYFDVANGVILQRSTVASVTTTSLILRSSASGSVSDANAVAQASWNVDTFGAGALNPSGKTLDLTKSQILFIQLQFLGVGRVQVGFVIDGAKYLAHEFYNTNAALSTVYMSSGSLPVRMEVHNTNTSDGATTLDTFCTSVSSGGLGSIHQSWYGSTGTANPATSTTWLPVLALRAAATIAGGSIVNRAHVVPYAYELVVASQTHEYMWVLNPTYSNTPTWAAPTNAGATVPACGEVSTNMTISVGTPANLGYAVDGGYLPASTQTKGNVVGALQTNPLVRSALNDVQDSLCLLVRSIASTGNVSASIPWREYY